MRALSENFTKSRLFLFEETVSNFILEGSKITADVDCSHEIKRCLLLGRKVMTNLDNILAETLLCQQRSV